MIITKDIILDTFEFIDVDTGNPPVNKQMLSDLIDRWKYLLVNRGARRGNSLALAFTMVDANHLALLFAAAELGMCVLILDKPVVRETIDRTRAAVFAPMDFLIYDKYIREDPLRVEAFNRYSKTIIYDEEIDEVTEKFTEIWAQPEDPYIGTSSSGTTGAPVPYYYSQKLCYMQTYRCAKLFKYEEDSVVCHTRNMHHLSSMMIGILPALAATSKHYFYNIYNPAGLEGFADFIKEHSVDRAFIGSEWVIKGFVKAATERGIRFDKTLIGSMSGFTIPKEYIEYCDLLNMEIMSHIGAVGVAAAPVINHVTKDSVYEPNWLGKVPDDFYQIEVIDGIPHIRSREDDFSTLRILEDRVEVVGDKWYHLGRTSMDPVEEVLRKVTGKDLNVYGNHIVFWEDCDFSRDCTYHVHHLDKELWTTETKVNVYQLLGYLEKISN